MKRLENMEQEDIGDLSLVVYPDEILTKQCDAVRNIDDRLQQIVTQMSLIMFQARGVGLAAPQVGIMSNFFLASPSSSPEDLQVYVNPHIVSGEGSVSGEEGCLSFPDVYANIKRAGVVTVEATGLDGGEFTRTLSDFEARIVQHEYDHLEGITIADRMGSVGRLSNRKTLRKLEEEFGVY